jgi:pyridoxamine 5'-phosphate oxidase
MINFININKQKPFIKFKEEYDRALLANQDVIEAISVSSFCNVTKIVDARFVNLKIVDGDEFIFFSNYNSPKSKQFTSHQQVAVSLYWSATNVQIRIKAQIRKKSPKYNEMYFSKRSHEKNALAISSNQSNFIESYKEVENNYHSTLENNDLQKCPQYWGGFSLKPYYFEFWEGHDSRLNKRESFVLNNMAWDQFYLQP